MTTRIELNHLARVEGHGGVTVELDGDEVRTARLEVFEGARLIEGLVRGRRYDEVAPMVSRICAICSAAHTLASLGATERAFGFTPGPETLMLRDLLLRGESIESHALHVFLLAAPDYLRAPSAIALAAEHREVVALGLRLKRLGNTIQEVVGGRAIHPVNAVPGGFGRRPAMDQLIRIRAALEQGVSDARATLDFVTTLPPQEAGRSDSAYAAARPPAGYGYEATDQIAIELNGRCELIPASAYKTILAEHTLSHSHAKHSRWNGTPITVGSLARIAVNGARLPPSGVAAAARLGLTPPFQDPLANNGAQVVELVVDVERALALVDQLLHLPPGSEPRDPVVPRAGTGTAALEAPRGLLIHSYRYGADGRLQQADIITPTAINAASIEHRLRKAVEQSPERDEASLTHRLEMVVRAYDPCLSCSVH